MKSQVKYKKKQKLYITSHTIYMFIAKKNDKDLNKILSTLY